MAVQTRSKALVARSSAIPILYRIFFLYIEPVATFAGAYYAQLQPSTYLTLTHAKSAPGAFSPLPIVTTTVLTQLANLYFCFALNEALVLRATNDIKVWKTLLFGLLVADFGHLASVFYTGTPWDLYVSFWTWNEMAWGNVGFVYVGALMRICFLSGVGF